LTPTAGKPIRIVLADDHEMVRIAFKGLLESQPDFAVVGEASDGLQALECARRLTPDIVLLDLSMPVRAGLDVLADIAAITGVSVLVLTAVIDRAGIVEVVKRGARGVVLKEASAGHLMKAVRSVVAGELWIGRDVFADVVDYMRSSIPAADPRDRFRLTPRELEIVRHIVEGGTNKDIATSLSISEDTVKHHLRNVFDKLGVSNRLELGLFAVSNRLVE
jgi:two-component system nitrate/nitrite response regulator NarL